MNSIQQLSIQVNFLLAWGRAKPTAHTVARLGEFTKSDTESLRRLLRKECLSGNPAVTGEWRKGYELAVGQERVGVTNGRGSFKIYYRRSTLNGYGRATGDQPIPFDGSPQPYDSDEDDYGLEAAI